MKGLIKCPIVISVRVNNKLSLSLCEGSANKRKKQIVLLSFLLSIYKFFKASPYNLFKANALVILIYFLPCSRKKKQEVPPAAPSLLQIMGQ